MINIRRILGFVPPYSEEDREVLLCPHDVVLYPYVNTETNVALDSYTGAIDDPDSVESISGCGEIFLFESLS